MSDHTHTIRWARRLCCCRISGERTTRSPTRAASPSRSGASRQSKGSTPERHSSGLFVSPARFVAEHKQNPSAELSIHGVEKTDETGRLCRLNLAVHGLKGEIKHGGNINRYYDDPHDATDRFDFVLANPAFNVNAVDKERLKDMVGPAMRTIAC